MKEGGGGMGGTASRENRETKKIIRRTSDCNFHETPERKIDIKKGNEKKFNYMNLHFFHEKMKLKKMLFIFFFVYSSQFHICLRSFSLQLKSKNIILYRIHTFKCMYVDR